MQEKGLGWVLFAWIVLLTAGIMAIIDGIVALGSSAFWTTWMGYGHRVVFGSLHTWGWIVLILGVLEILAAASVWKGGAYGRWFGIIIASHAMIHWMFWIPIMPFWALVATTLAFLVIYALAVYGGQGAEE
jgi:hypothetical protein